MKHEEIGEIAYELHQIQGDLMIISVNLLTGAVHGKKAHLKIRAINERLQLLFLAANKLYIQTKKEEDK